MTVQEFQAGNIERMGYTLAHYLATTQADKCDWKPHIEGAAGIRSALDLVAECILVNRAIAAVLRGETPPPFRPNEITERPFTDNEDAQTQLIASAKECADAIRAMSDEDLTRTYTTRRGSTPGAMVIETPYRNMAYHGGQINLFQLLYGDTEFRMPLQATKPA